MVTRARSKSAGVFFRVALEIRMTELTWYHFVPAMALAIGSFILNMSTLVY